MRHAILGAGGVGGLIGGALAHSGRQVLLLMRAETLARYGGRVRVESRVAGEFEVGVAAAERLEAPVDVLWVTTKAMQLEPALEAAPPEALGGGVVIPLLNGVDHVKLLRERYGDRVIPGAIRVESERVGVDRFVQPGPFASTDLAPPSHLRGIAEAVCEEMRAARLSCDVRDAGEAGILWGKLAILGPMALATSSIGQPLGGVRDDPEARRLLLESAREVIAVAATEGAAIDAERIEAALLAAPGEMRTSMQKDLVARRPLELDAIGGAIVRRGREHGIPTPATEELMRRVEARAARGVAESDVT